MTVLAHTIPGSTIVVLLISGCASIETDWYRVKLHKAIMEENTKRVESLLNSGADVNMKFDDKGILTPLMVATLEGKTEVVKVLLAHGADVNIKANSGATALSLASENGFPGIVKLLKQSGAK
ncbi:MAG: ankyrin repeat domain-containing protein [Nitrospirae bacterium]|nr:ankyrin repeat domain-containing protein [Nitrospirota bacterium]